MTEKQPLDLNLTVADLLKAWPQVIPVFIRHRMSCVGCDMSPFETLQDVADNYKIAPEALLRELFEMLPSAPTH